MNFLSPQMKKPAANQAKAVILPVACAGTAPAALAVGKGPETILQASQVLSTYDVETNTELGDLGLLTLNRVDCPPDPQASVERCTTRRCSITARTGWWPRWAAAT